MDEILSVKLTRRVDGKLSRMLNGKLVRRMNGIGNKILNKRFSVWLNRMLNRKLCWSLNRGLNRRVLSVGMNAFSRYRIYCQTFSKLRIVLEAAEESEESKSRR